MSEKEQPKKASPGQAMLDRVREEMAECSDPERANLNKLLKLMFSKDSRVETGRN